MKADWSTATLGELTARTRPIQYGVLKPGPFDPEGVPLLRIQDLADNRVANSGLHFISHELDNEFSRSRLAGGEILLSIQGTIGRVALAPRSLAGANISRTLAVIAPDSRVDRGFLRHHLMWIATRRGFHSTGTTRASLNIGEIRQISVPIPPLDEQRRIAAVLDHADRLRSQRRQSISALARAPQDLFFSMFGDPRTWAAHWPMGRIGDMVLETQYGTASKAGETGAWPILRMGNITDDGRVDLSDLKYIDLSDRDVEKYTARRRDLLFNRTNSSAKVGKSAVVHTDQPLAIAGYLVRVRFKHGHSADFVSAYLGSPHGSAIRRRMAKAAVNQANINPTEMQSIPIALPPLKLQQEYSARVADFYALRDSAEHHLAGLNALFTSLSSRAFAGELDVSKVDLSA